jgi:predicted amidohydrolase
MATDGGRARSEVVRLALAQIDCALGDVAENARRVRQTLAAPMARSADVVVFPELTLTGYALGYVGEDVSRAVTDAEIAGLATETDRTALVVGFAEAGRVHTYNSAVYVEGGRVLHLHRKLYLPNYDIWEERKHFTPGSAMRAFDTGFGRMAILLCSDAWQPALAVLAVQDGARVLIVPANSTVRRPDIEEQWRDITRFYARTLQCYVVFVNRVGVEPGLRFWGGSHVYGPEGELVAEAPRDEPALLSADLDLAAVRRVRREMPLLKEARLGLLSREIERLAAEGGDL